MLNFPNDIRRRAETDFGRNAEKVLMILSDLSADSRVVRCILFLADGKWDKLEQAVQMAKTDWRDVIMCAEYDQEERRVRNFEHPFAEKLP